LGPLQTALRSLSLRQRALIILHYQEGFSIAEMAEILSIPEGTVKSRLYHARNRIRAEMEDDSHDQP
jgi:RNA polymerase sigma-70 factor (ECF subfamily)